MSVYSRYVFPRFLDWAMTISELAHYRGRLLAKATGDILEIGFGTGVNLPFYPPGVKRLTVLEPNEGMTAISRKRMRKSPIEIDYKAGRAENLPFENATFDTVVSTVTLCSIAGVDQALQEIKRVLKPGGQFLFLEHGLSRDPEVEKWQNRLNGVNQIVGDGCNLNRDMRKLIEENGFSLSDFSEGYMKSPLKTHAYLYTGTARPR